MQATAYQPPEGFVSKVIPDPGELLEACSAFIERRGSLPRVRAEAPLEELEDEALAELAALLDELQIAEARLSADALVEYAIPNEKDGSEIENAPHHIEWHRFLDAHSRAVIIAPVEHAKTTHIGVGRTLYLLGRNPGYRGVFVSNTAAQAEKVLGVVRLHIEANPRLHKVFPDLKPSDRVGDPWHASAITVARETMAKDPSIQAIGIGGPINGSRLDGAVVDDILDFENTRTAEQCQKVIAWFETTLLTRLTKGAFVHVIGTPWSALDLLHVLETRPGFASRRYSAVQNPHDPWDRWIPIWPEQFTRERLRSIYDDMTPGNFSKKYLCLIVSDETSRFALEWFHAAERAGRAFRTWPVGRLKTGGGMLLPTFTGVDLAMGRKKKSDLTAIVTIAIDDRGRRIVLDCQSGRWKGPEILTLIKAQYDRYDSIITVEDNGAQGFLLQWALDWNIPVTPFTTGQNKYSERFGVESLAIEFRAGEWVFPSGAPIPGSTTEEVGLPSELAALRHEMMIYDPTTHTGDRMMALWFAREAARQRGIGIVRHMPTLAR